MLTKDWLPDLLGQQLMESGSMLSSEEVTRHLSTPSAELSGNGLLGSFRQSTFSAA